jgi:hypothetical protein
VHVLSSEPFAKLKPLPPLWRLVLAPWRFLFLYFFLCLLVCLFVCLVVLIKNKHVRLRVCWFAGAWMLSQGKFNKYKHTNASFMCQVLSSEIEATLGLLPSPPVRCPSGLVLPAHL